MTGPVVYDRLPASVPPTGSVLLDALLGGQCTRWQVQYIQTCSFPEVLSLNDVAASFWSAVVAAAVCDCEDVAASLVPPVAAAANAASATLLRQSVSAVAAQTARTEAHDSGRLTPTELSCPVQPRSWGLRSL